MIKTTITWSPKASETYLQILTELVANWPLTVALDFEKKVEELQNHLSSFKHIAPKSKKEGIRKLVVSKQTSIIYRIVSYNQIEIVTFVPNRSGHSY